MPELHVIGGGGHSKVVVALAEAAGYRIAGIYDDQMVQPAWVLGYPVLGPLALLPDEPGILAVLAIGSNAVRSRLSLRFRHIGWSILVHPAAWVAPTARIGSGSVIMAGAVVQSDAVIGRHVIVNTGATVDHDCSLGDYVHIAPGCCLAGGVTLEEGTFLGIGTKVIPDRTVGSWAVVGAGGVVNRDLPANVTAVGVPARVVKERPTGWQDV